MSVPPGFYEVGVLPIGLVNVPREFRRFEVSADTRTRFKMTLIGRKPETEVELVGLSPRDFPVTVYPQPLDDILDDDVRLMFCGPYRWHLPEQKIAVPSYPAYLIATGRRACWISDRMVQLRGHHARVNMVPATTLEIHWHGEHVVRRRGAVVMVVSRLGTVWRRLRPKLEPSAGRMLPTLLGTVVVPRGKVLLECLLEEDGKTVWKRQVEADRPAFTVEVADEQ